MVPRSSFLSFFLWNKRCMSMDEFPPQIKKRKKKKKKKKKKPIIANKACSTYTHAFTCMHLDQTSIQRRLNPDNSHRSTRRGKSTYHINLVWFLRWQLLDDDGRKDTFLAVEFTLPPTVIYTVVVFPQEADDRSRFKRQLLVLNGRVLVKSSQHNYITLAEREEGRAAC